MKGITHPTPAPGRRAMARAALLVFAASLFLFQGNAVAGSGGSTTVESLGSGKRVNVIALPFSHIQRVPAPEKLLKRGAEKGATATITVNFLPPGPGQDKEVCATWPEQAKAAVNHAVNIWSNLVTTPVAITIDACWAKNLPNTALGSSGTNDYFKNFTGAPLTNTWYPSALANMLHGSTMSTSKADMYLSYNARYPFYYGTDGDCPANRYDLVSIVLHEITHGLGFGGAMGASAKTGQAGYIQKDEALPEPYDLLVKTGSGANITDTTLFPNPSAELYTQVTSDSLYFTGAKAKAANGNDAVKIYAPSKWVDGTSYCHLDWDTFQNTDNALMLHGIPKGTAVHTPGPVTMALLEDLGWTVAAITSRTLTVSKSGAGAGTISSAPRGIHYGATRRADFDEGEVVTLSATAGARSKFVGWSGTQCVGTGSCTILMDEDKSETATFAPCTYVLSSEIKTLASHRAATIPVSFAASDPGCPAPDIATGYGETWLSYTGLTYNSATGKGSLKIKVAANSASSVPRVGTMEIAGEAFIVIQDGKPCAISLKPAGSPLIAAAGGTGQFSITASPSDCSWTAAAHADATWIAVTSGASGTGNGTVAYTAAANDSARARSGKIDVNAVIDGTAKTKFYTVKQSR